MNAVVGLSATSLVVLVISLIIIIVLLVFLCKLKPAPPQGLPPSSPTMAVM
jgi:hypothetical protein